MRNEFQSTSKRATRFGRYCGINTDSVFSNDSSVKIEGLADEDVEALLVSTGLVHLSHQPARFLEVNGSPV